ncbi:GGDEF domain-containing phosphodiesterase [Romboutsia maritimum]|nr:GGDEF domain-containing phosphodiesterase [Romboutsia maritimum]
METLSKNNDRYNFFYDLKNTNYKYTILYIDIIKFRLINNAYGINESNLLLKQITEKIDKIGSNLKMDINICMYEKDIILIKLSNCNNKKLTALINSIVMSKYKYSINFRMAFMELYEYGDVLNFIENIKYVFKCKKYEVTDENYNIEDLNIEYHIKRYQELKNDILSNNNRFFSLVYQPKVELKYNNIISWEVLSRWNHPKYGFISPIEFIKIIKDLDREYEFDIYILEQMCKEISRLNFDHSIYSINISVNTLKNPNIYDKILEITSKYYINPSKITFEIVETSQVEDYDIITEIINNLNKMGYNISIDDFGTGYSSYYRLCNINFSEVKIPREFLPSKKDNREKKMAVLKGIVNMCKNLGCKTVIEGIETKDDHELASYLGVDYAQGYLYSHPVTIDESLKMIINS